MLELNLTITEQRYRYWFIDYVKFPHDIKVPLSP